MTDPAEIFTRPGISGWIVLSGGVPSMGDETPQLPEHILEKSNLVLPPLCVSGSRPLDGQLGTFIEDIEVLLGEPVEVAYLDELPGKELREILEAAGLAILAGGSASEWNRQFELSQLHTDHEIVLSNERLILAIGQAAAAMGKWILTSEDDDLVHGIGWLNGAMVLPNMGDVMDSDEVRGFLSSEEYVYALVLPEGAVLAFGPSGEVEVWGERQPVITLGRRWSEE